MDNSQKLIYHINLMGVCSTPPPRLQLLHGSPTDQGAGPLAWLRQRVGGAGPNIIFFYLAIIIFILLLKKYKELPPPKGGCISRATRADAAGSAGGVKFK
uniref:Uncharacterized protein n=1 Tax=Morchella importuna TaxID=1174673 RepID=A0A650AFB7_9PEZI|nr:hypothetical protein [Morchella importuna]QGN66720.1 hypothetical protein [Morchella importuna]